MNRPRVILSKDLAQSITQAVHLVTQNPKPPHIDVAQQLGYTSYGVLNERQAELVRVFIKDKPVYDLGAGNCSLSVQLLALGAASVCAIEKDPIVGFMPSKRLKLYPQTFQEFLLKRPKFRAPKDGVAFISWPANRELPGLLTLMNKFKTVIFLGCNTESTCCAWPKFYKELALNRPLIGYSPNSYNSLLVYGRRVKNLPPRELTIEEIAGIDLTKCYAYPPERP